MLDVLPIVFLVTGVALVLLFFWAYCRLFKYEDPVADLVEHETARLTYPRTRYPVERGDLYPMFGRETPVDLDYYQVEYVLE